VTDLSARVEAAITVLLCRMTRDNAPDPARYRLRWSIRATVDIVSDLPERYGLSTPAL
jgi:hypothetical protein